MSLRTGFFIVIAFWAGFTANLFAQQNISYYEPQEISTSVQEAASPTETQPHFQTDVQNDIQTEVPIVTNAHTVESAPSRVVTGGFVPAEDTTRIQQVQAFQNQSGQSPRVASAGRNTAFGNSSTSAQEEQINTMIGAKYVKIERPQELPGGHKQIWRKYDITPYTKQRGLDPATKPEQTIVDWIIRQTGINTWHSEPVGFLNATSETLYVYHTLDMHRRVAEIVDRFVNPDAAGEGFTFRVISIGSPDWLTRSHAYLKPLDTQTPGVQGWVVERSYYPTLLQELAKRSDYREHCPPQYMVPNGCRYYNGRSRSRSYLRDVQPSPQAPGYVTDTQTVDEGFSFDFVPLTCLDGINCEVMLNLAIVQVDQMLPVTIEIPTQDNPRARHTIETPLIVPFKLDGQIRWLKDRILILDLGMQPLPEVTTGESKGILAGIKKVTATGANRGRANYLLFIEKTLTPMISPLQTQPAGTTQASQTPTNTATAPVTSGIPSVLTGAAPQQQVR